MWVHARMHTCLCLCSECVGRSRGGVGRGRAVVLRTVMVLCLQKGVGEGGLGPAAPSVLMPPPPPLGGLHCSTAHRHRRRAGLRLVSIACLSNSLSRPPLLSHTHTHTHPLLLILHYRSAGWPATCCPCPTVPPSLLPRPPPPPPLMPVCCRAGPQLVHCPLRGLHHEPGRAGAGRPRGAGLTGTQHDAGACACKLQLPRPVASSTTTTTTRACAVLDPFTPHPKSPLWGGHPATRPPPLPPPNRLNPLNPLPCMCTLGPWAASPKSPKETP